MKKQTLLFGKNIMLASFFLLITISLVQSFGFSLNSVKASVNVTNNNATADKNSTFSQSDLNKDNNEIGMTIVIPNSNSNSNNTSTPTPSSSTSPPSSSSLSKIPDKEDSTSKTSINSSSNQPHNLQRGEYKVDENGIHYYNINNCSEAKGSSGIGNLSECEDAEREMREEL